MKDKPKKAKIQIKAIGQKDADAQLGKMIMNPALNGSVTIQSLIEKSIPQSNGAMVFTALQDKQKEIDRGDLSDLEHMLHHQAVSLDYMLSIFVHKMSITEHLNSYQIYANLAIKAQSACRNTVATLASIKQPKSTTFIKNQALNQQVNFEFENKSNQSNELLRNTPAGVEFHEEMDFGRSQETVRVNQELETME
jgi:hypothetical protein